MSAAQAFQGSDARFASIACDNATACSGANGQSGATCLSRSRFQVVEGQTYTISTCGASSGDTYLKVLGACECANDDACGTGSSCTCTAGYTGEAVVCGSTYGSATASWNYTITSGSGGGGGSGSGTVLSGSLSGSGSNGQS